MPNIQYVFEDKDENGLNHIWELTPRQYMIDFVKIHNEDHLCFDMRIFEDYPILGQNAMRGYDVVFDKDNLEVRFTPAKCD